MTDLSRLMPAKSVRLYKQAAVIARFQGTLVAQWVYRMREHFKNTYGDVWMFWSKGEDAQWFFQEPPMHLIAAEFIERTKDGIPPDFVTLWVEAHKTLEALSRQIAALSVEKLSFEELERWYNDMLARHAAMWALGIFIDSLDAGEDQAEISRIAAMHGLSSEEVQILTTPHVASYATDWEMALWDVQQGRRSVQDVAHDFFWIRTDYHFFDEVDENFIARSAKDAHEVHWTSTKKEEQNVLAARGLSKSPLEVFQTLTQWRDDRKKANFVGLYALMRILTEVGKRRGIEPPYVRNLIADEAKTLFREAATPELLHSSRTRFDTQTFIFVDNNGKCSAVDGEDAVEAFKMLMDHIPRAQSDELRGTVACRGKATGRVRVVAGPDSPSARVFEAGDILVTSMTRPEFVPLMKLCAAIITDEGGITSHAAIVSRELRKPCIIGTKHATEVLHDGDMVEVDADKGIVRKLN